MPREQGILVRITPDIGKRCDAVAELMQQRMPGLRVTRTDVIRMGLQLGLERLESEHRNAAD